MMKKIGEMVKNYFVNYFIPHAGNDNKPHILRPRAIAFVVMVALVANRPSCSA